MRILFCGDRGWTDTAKISAAFDEYQPTLVIEGEAKGADRLAREEANRRRIPVLPFRAKWEEYGRAAGPIRNRQMLDEGEPDLVLAFHSDLDSSKGTKNMVYQARKRGIPVIVIE